MDPDSLGSFTASGDDNSFQTRAYIESVEFDTYFKNVDTSQLDKYLDPFGVVVGVRDEGISQLAKYLEFVGGELALSSGNEHLLADELEELMCVSREDDEWPAEFGPELREFVPKVRSEWG